MVIEKGCVCAASAVFAPLAAMSCQGRPFFCANILIRAGSVPTTYAWCKQYLQMLWSSCSLIIALVVHIYKCYAWFGHCCLFCVPCFA